MESRVDTPPLKGKNFEMPERDVELCVLSCCDGSGYLRSLLGVMGLEGGRGTLVDEGYGGDALGGLPTTAAATGLKQAQHLGHGHGGVGGGHEGGHGGGHGHEAGGQGPHGPTGQHVPVT